MKQVIIVRKDLKLSKGKMASQVSHASVEAVLRSDKKIVSKWRDTGMKKVVVECADKKELFSLKMQAEQAGIVSALIADAGRTEVEPGTETCLAIGPDSEEKIDKISCKLKMV
jgi:PTH2 family peptidyl-tRNA hydrolase